MHPKEKIQVHGSIRGNNVSVKKIILLAVLISFIFLSPFLFSQSNKLEVITIRAYIQTAPETESPIIEVVEKGAVLVLLSPGKKGGDWYYVSYYSETNRIMVSGFIHTSFVEMMVETPEIIPGEKVIIYQSPRPVQVIFEQANIRTEPDFKGHIIHQAQYGISLQAVGKKGGWYRVNLSPGEYGLVVAGYIHQSFVQDTEEKVPVDIKGKKPVLSFQPAAESVKKKVRAKLGVNCLIFSESSLRNTHGGGIGYEAEVSFGVLKNFEVWLGSSYFYKSQSGNRIKILPVGTGVKYGLSRGKFNFFGGVGLNYYTYEESTPAFNASKGGMGYVVKLGSNMKVMKESIIDFHINYSYCRVEAGGIRKNIGGIEVGIAIGYTF
jgi:hypothetical protein